MQSIGDISNGPFNLFDDDDTSMREEVINKIDGIVETGVRKVGKSMRWKSWYLISDGIVNLHSRRDRKEYSEAIHLSNTTREDFEKLSNSVLVSVLVLLSIQSARQM